MSVIKCKMCGGDLVISPGTTICECEYCGSKQTIPNTDDEKRLKLYERANKLRFNCDFDKAAGVYESIVSEFQDEAEAYWGLVLCKYGIEYVDDPKTGKKIPTCHRSSFDSVMDDGNFELVMENADVISRGVYREEAKQIEELRKGIIEVSSKEEPYDIFICYKETDESGQRTIDSVIAQDVYDALTEEGYKVFFSRISLEDKLGQEYEPYIFAALNSAKVMLAFGTQYEYYNAVWVKNEWSRFLQLMEAGQKKTLIPCYKNIDAYDMPKEFAKLQAQDMGKVGAIQDLIRGIKKIVPIIKEEPLTAAGIVPTIMNGENTEPLLKRAFMFLEDGEWSRADDFLEQILNRDPENAQAYLGKLMVEKKVRIQDDLMDCEQPFDASSNYQKAVRFGNEELSSKLKDYVVHIQERKENSRLSGIYEEATSLMKQAATSSAGEQIYKTAAEKFRSIREYKDADNLVTVCLNLAEESRKGKIYYDAKTEMESDNIKSVEDAIDKFRTLAGWNDVDQLILDCQERINKLKEKQEKERQEREQKVEQARLLAEKAAEKRKRNIKIVLAVAGFLIVIAIIGIWYYKSVVPNSKYIKANELMSEGNYEEASFVFESLKGYKDSEDKANEAASEVTKANVQKLIQSGEYKEAYELLLKTGDESNTELTSSIVIKMIEAEDYTNAFTIMKSVGINENIKNVLHEKAMELIGIEEYDRALQLLKEYDHEHEGEYNFVLSSIQHGKYDQAYKRLSVIGDQEFIETNIKDRSKKAISNGDIKEAVILLSSIKDFDGRSLRYEYAKDLLASDDYIHAYGLLVGLDYQDSESLLEDIKPLYFRSLMGLNTGDKVYLGSDETGTIEWVVLGREGEIICLLSEYALTMHDMCGNSEESLWEECSLRRWLNEDFYYVAFSEEEQSLIYDKQMNDLNTIDKVSCPSKAEVTSFSSVLKKCLTVDKLVDSDWWLRQNIDSDKCEYVTKRGTISKNVSKYGKCGVRPMIYIDISKIQF